MPKYTTGELAKLTGVSVRTVQYYDARGILLPSEVTDGGRRTYNEDDLRKLKIICFLRDLDLPIDSIKELLAEPHPENVIAALLEERESALLSDISDKQRKVERLAEVKRSLGQMESFSVESIGDIACLMERKRKLWSLRVRMLALGLVGDAIEVGTLLLWILRGVWLPFALGMPVVIALSVAVCKIYCDNAVYICPECHCVFKPRAKETLFARHTPSTRKLTCPQCKTHGFCIETHRMENDYYA